MAGLVQVQKKSFWDRYGILIFFAVFSALLLSVCSMCSFLFPIHNRVDQNVFFTIGREMLDGKIIYRDLFEHKGPLTYFIHAAAAAVSSSSFIGVYLIEVVSLTVFMVFAYKTALLFTNRSFSFYAVLTLVSVLLCSECFLRGDNVEELCLPLLMISTYYMLRAVPFERNKTPKPQTPFVIFINGVLFGTVLWIKFNLVGFWIGWVLVTFLPLLLRKNFKKFFYDGMLFLLGLTATALPWLFYFAWKGALHDFLYTYFYCNIFLYKDNAGIFVRIVSVLLGIGRNLIGNLILIAASVYGLIRLCSVRVYSPLITYAGLYAGVFFGGRWYAYYYLILAFYALFGIVYVLEDLKAFRAFAWLRSHMVKGITLWLALCLAGSLLCSNCLPFYSLEKSSYPQFRFASYIKNSGIPNPTLLNYGFIDQGFYFAAGISPINKYFCRVNIPYGALPEMYDEQKELIDRQAVDFVVVRIAGTGKSIEKDYIDSITISSGQHFQNPPYVIDPDNLPLLFENYELVMEMRDPYEEYLFGLFCKKS
ncbi:MAG: glycosyltransferase family 39 protein [Clostridia bacterium]